MRTNALITAFARHPTAANLLMALLIIGGLVGLARLNTQFFPDFAVDIVTISIEWPGASAEDVDANIVQAVEPEVRFLDGIKKVVSSSQEGLARLRIEFYPGTDMQAALADVETAVGQVRTLPEDSERPEIRRLIPYDSVTRIVISGAVPPMALKAVAKRMRDDLLDRGIDKIDLLGVRDEEIWVDIDPATLLRYDLTLEEIAATIANASIDLPSGDTGGPLEHQIRSLGLRRDAAGLAGLEIRALGEGEKVYLSDIATVREAFEEDGVSLRRKGLPAVQLHVQRALGNDALKVADTVDAYLAETVPTLPPEFIVEQHSTLADVIRSRIDLLVRNGITGLVLVVVILFVFLNGRIAIWVTVGIPVALMSTLAAMLATGQSLNMVSLFGLIMVLGIVVDDAIVVAEHAETKFRAGMRPLEAVISGAERMAVPVFCASITTVAAFIPLFLITDILGEIIRAIPFAVVTAIFASLIECFLVLPAHLRGAFRHAGDRTPGRFRRRFDLGLARFRDGPFRRLVEGAVTLRYLTVALALALLIVAIGLVAGGRIAFSFFPSPEGDRIYLNLEMIAGTPPDDTRRVLEGAEAALKAAERSFDAGAGPIVRMSQIVVGTGAGRTAGAEGIDGDHIGGMTVELIPSEERSVRTSELIERWRQALPAFPGVESLTILPAQTGPPGRDIDVRINGTDLMALRRAADDVSALLARLPAVSEVADDLPYGKPEMILEVTPRGEALGFNTLSVGRQVRDAFEGAIATRFPRGDEEVTVRLQFARDTLDRVMLDRMIVRGPGGAEVALSDVVDVREEIGFARVMREDGRRQVSVTAEIESRIASSGDVIDALWRNGLAAIGERYGVTFQFAGRAEEQAQTFADMKLGTAVALAAIYIVLAWVFASYVRPLVVMSIIPLAFIGVSFGHLLLGFDLTILSMVALLGLSGVVVNDSIILVTTIEDRKSTGASRRDAIVSGTQARLRAIILTSATTIGGLLPLLFERSLQAQFLIPMAVTIVFGLLGTTLLVLVVVPALLGIEDDIRALAQRRTGNDKTAATGQQPAE